MQEPEICIPSVNLGLGEEDWEDCQDEFIVYKLFLMVGKQGWLWMGLLCGQALC